MSVVDEPKFVIAILKENSFPKWNNLNIEKNYVKYEVYLLNGFYDKTFLMLPFLKISKNYEGRS